MSLEATKWARMRYAGGAIEKCVLLNLAAVADANGLCLISRGELAQRSELSHSAAERALVTLGANGLIFRGARAEFIEIKLMMDGEGK